MAMFNNQMVTGKPNPIQLAGKTHYFYVNFQ